MVVEADLMLGPGPAATLVVGPDVAAEPMMAVAGLLAELDPKGVVLGLYAAVASKVADVDGVVGAVPTGPGAAAFGLEADPMLVPFAVVESVPMLAELEFALEDGSRLYEHGLGGVPAPEEDSMIAGFESCMHLSVLGAVLVLVPDVIPKEVGMGIDLQLLPEPGLDAMNVPIAAVVFAFGPQTR